MKFIDLFAGIGGFRYGLENVDRNQNRDGKKDSETKPENGQGLESETGENPDDKKRRTFEYPNGESNKRTFTCIWSNEWDKYASQIYKKHYGECDTKDIRTVDTSEIPDHDLLCAGFPCQSFSIAGKRLGFEDTRGTMFFEIARIIRDKRPRYFLLENVKGLLSHDEGKTFQTILGVLSDLGYEYQWQVLNSKNFGVPQNRERVFIVGHPTGTSRPEVFPIGESYSISHQEKYAEQAGRSRISSTIDARYGSLRNSGETYLHYIGGIKGKRDMWLKDSKQHSRNFSQGQRVYSSDGIASTLAGNAGGLGGKTGLYATEGLKIRRLTPLECERLQGFPDGWTEGASDTQRYKCLGNAVTTTVITEIGRRFIESKEVNRL